VSTPQPMPGRKGTALVVVDMQNGFCAPNGSCARVGLPVSLLQPAIEPCIRAVKAARAAGVPIIFTRYVYRADFSDGGFLVNEKLPALRTEQALISNTWDADLLPDLKPQPQDYILDKNRPSSFYATPLETWLNGLGVRELVVCGVTTNVCVETTVRDASQRDYRTFVLQDAVAEYDPERHAASLKAMGMLFAHLLTTSVLERAWRA
jgi:ureidoacrylate peracid hydrolase